MAINARAVVVLGKPSKAVHVKPVPVLSTSPSASISATNFVVLNKRVEEEPVTAPPPATEKPKRVEPQVEARAPEPKGLFAHKHSQFLHDMLKEQN